MLGVSMRYGYSPRNHRCSSNNERVKVTVFGSYRSKDRELLEEKCSCDE